MRAWAFKHGALWPQAKAGVLWVCLLPKSNRSHRDNHDDPFDVKRCWSPENIHAMEHKPNKEKWNTIVHSIASTVPVEWEGSMPCEG